MKISPIPQSWLIALLLTGMVILRALNIDSWTTAILSSIAGYLLGREIMPQTTKDTTQLDEANLQIKDLETQIATLTHQKPPQ